jgi:hypothetical protein
MAFNPALPVNGSLISAIELRNQLNALNDYCNQLATSKIDAPTVTTLSQTISNPPTQAQVQAIQNKLNELILALEP